MWSPSYHRNQALQRIRLQASDEEVNLEINPKWIVESNSECDGGLILPTSVRVEMPSALFTSNDMMAMGVIHAAAHMAHRFQTIFFDHWLR
ncbi:hypothetical protein O9993_03355 [Vibrio lentus]|nr:hypothetical protein [Vibrio lentus]